MWLNEIINRWLLTLSKYIFQYCSLSYSYVISSDLCYSKIHHIHSCCFADDHWKQNFKISTGLRLKWTYICWSLYEVINFVIDTGSSRSSRFRPSRIRTSRNFEWCSDLSHRGPLSYSSGPNCHVTPIYHYSKIPANMVL